MKLDFFNSIAGMNRSLVVALLIVHRIYLIYDTVYRENFSFSQCGFKASGNGPLDCMNKCTDNPMCSYLSCEKICNECVDKKQRCPWDPNNEFFKEDGKMVKSDINDPPPAPNVNLTTTERQKLSLSVQRILITK